MENLFLYLSKVRDVLNKEISHLYFNRDFLGACHSCNGRDHNVSKVDAAVQTKKVLEYKKVSNLEQNKISEVDVAAQSKESLKFEKVNQ